MPYNKPMDVDDIDENLVSDDSISDFPLVNWEVPPSITKPPV